MFLFMDRLSIDAIICYYMSQTDFFCFAVDEKNKHPATFWSCLHDIQEGLQVICQSVSNVFLFFLISLRINANGCLFVQELAI
jgi:hypothetical protein